MTRPAVDWVKLWPTQIVLNWSNKSLKTFDTFFLGIVGTRASLKILCVINLVWACLNNQITHKANLLY